MGFLLTCMIYDVFLRISYIYNTNLRQLKNQLIVMSAYGLARPTDYFAHEIPGPNEILIPLFICFLFYFCLGYGIQRKSLTE